MLLALLTVVTALPAAPANSREQAAKGAAEAPASESLFRQLAPGLLVRERFSTQMTGDRSIVVWDLLVGPGMRSGSVVLPGSAVLEVRGGAGEVMIEGRSQRLPSGATVAVAAGAPVQFVNARRDLGLALRATLVVEGRK